MKTGFSELCSFLEKDLGWPLGEYPFEELTFAYDTNELGICTTQAAKINSLHQLRPISRAAAWNIFFVDFETKKLSVETMREVLSALVTIKRASAQAAQRAIFPSGSLLFIVRYGIRKEPCAAIVRFQDSPQTKAPAIQILEWSQTDPAPRLKRVRQILTHHLEWPANPSDVKAWHTQWSAAFDEKIETPEVIEEIERYEVARLLNAPLDQTPLSSLTQNALFKHIDFFETEIRKILFRNREHALYSLELIRLLIAGKERFDRVLATERIESRERHLRYLQQTEPRFSELITSCDAISGGKDPSSLASQIDAIAEICWKIAFNKITINQSVERFLSSTQKESIGPKWQTKEEHSEQIKLLKSWLKGREKLKDVITVSSVKRLNEIASEADDGRVEQEDLMQFAFIGLTQAMERFDWKQGGFNQYIYWPVRNAIKAGIETSAFLSGVPEDLKEYAKKLQHVRYSHRQETGCAPTNKEMGDALGLSEEQVRKIFKHINMGEVEFHRNSQSIYGRADLLGYMQDDSVWDAIQIEDLKESIMDVLDTLTDREKEVLASRFGIEDGYALTLEEMAQRYQTSPERIRQIEAKALRKLRHPNRIWKLDGFIEL